MPGKTKINIHQKMTKTELEEEMSKYVEYYRYYLRLIAMKIISNEESIKPASDLLNISYQTVHR